MTHSIAGRTVVVTGGSKGIGFGIAQVFAGAGAKVAIIARHADQAQNAAALIRSGDVGLAGDVTDMPSLTAAFAAAADHFGGIDVLCANAGIFPRARLETMTEVEWDHVSDTNLKGTFLSVQAAIPYLKAAGAGRIVLTSSITGPVTGLPGWTHYAASKAGQLGFMRTAALELAGFGITVKGVLPGNIMTEGMVTMGADYQAAMARTIPMGKLGVVTDIGHAALYFASAEASYVTGQTLIIDGGQILPESIDTLA